MQSDIDMTDDNFQALAYGQRFSNEIWSIVANFTNLT
jgi:hypothetical protein